MGVDDEHDAKQPIADATDGAYLESGIPELTQEVPSPDFVWVNYRQPHWKRKQLMLKAHPELAKLVKPEPRSAFIVIALVFVQYLIASRLASAGTSLWINTAVAWLVGGVVAHGLWVMIHELTHDSFFVTKKYNIYFQLLCNMPLALPCALSFRHYHLMHHGYMGEPYNDPDLPGPFEAKFLGRNPFGKAMWLLLYPLWQSLRVTRYNTGRNSERAHVIDYWFVLNYLTTFGALALTFYFMGWRAVWYLGWSHAFAVGLHPMGGRWIAEHYAARPNQETYSYYGNFNYIAFNIGHHNEHHDLPGVPWTNLPKIRSIAKEFYDPLYHHLSYTRLLLDFIFSPSYTLESRVLRPPKKLLCLPDEVAALKAQRKKA